jgi:RIO kinase 1
MRSEAQQKMDWWLQLDENYEDEAITRPRKTRPGRPKRTVTQERSELAEQLDQPESGYPFTYKAARHEATWISTSLERFYDDSLISDVLRIVKGGKEANVYCCQANPALGLDLLAAKIYRPRMLRNLKNDALYREGRAVLDDEGKALRDTRSLRAIRKKTRIGSEMSITSWIEHEYRMLEELYRAGADVPEPIAQAGNAILMAYIGEEGNPAPTLSEVTLSQAEARPMFERLMENVRLMLEHHLIHADLSAYNVLYWEGAATIIDFPQGVDSLRNRRAFDLLRRDVERLCQYFARYGLRADARALSGELWNRYERGRMEDM